MIHARCARGNRRRSALSTGKAFRISPSALGLTIAMRCGASGSVTTRTDMPESFPCLRRVGVSPNVVDRRCSRDIVATWPPRGAGGHLYGSIAAVAALDEQEHRQ